MERSTISREKSLVYCFFRFCFEFYVNFSFYLFILWGGGGGEETACLMIVRKSNVVSRAFFAFKMANEAPKILQNHWSRLSRNA